MQTQLEAAQRKLMPLSKTVTDAQAKLTVSEEELSLHCSNARAHEARLNDSKENLVKVML